MSRTVFISNHHTVRKKEGILEYEKSIGGLATGLKSYHEQSDSIWAGWTGMKMRYKLPLRANSTHKKAEILRMIILISQLFSLLTIHNSTEYDRPEQQNSMCFVNILMTRSPTV